MLLRLALPLALAAGLAAQQRPNVLWITAEDHGPDLGCYGVEFATTPNLDTLASRGVRYARCWSNAPVCAPARTAILLGVHPPSIGALNMRSSVPLPDGMRPFPAILRDAGYYTSNNSKTDYNVRLAESPWDVSSRDAHWRHRGDGQPFFAVFNLTQSHESQIRKRPHQAVHDPAEVDVPPFHPDTPEVRQDWAQYHDRITTVDERVGRILEQLHVDGLDDETVVIFFADHGSGMPGHKRTAKNTGLHVPLIVHVPAALRDVVAMERQDGSVTEELVSFVDLAPTVLSLCGVEPPQWMHGRAFLGEHAQPAPSHSWGYRGRMDERVDCVRTVTDGRYVYVRNLMPRLPHGQHVAYQFRTPSTRVWKRMFDAGELNAAQRAFWQVPRAAEELYDLRRDPHEVVDLATDPEHARTLEALRGAWLAIERRFGDAGLVPESLRDLERPVGAGDTASLLGVVDRVSRRASGDPAALIGLTRSADPVVRWWALQGIAGLGGDLSAEVRSAVRAHLDDDAAGVVVLAAEIVAMQTEVDDRCAAIELLCAHADPAAHGYQVALDAWNALDRLDQRAAPFRARIEAIPLRPDQRPPRGSAYLERLREHALAGIGG